jgi:hypothetical protein
VFLLPSLEWHVFYGSHPYARACARDRRPAPPLEGGLTYHPGPGSRASTASQTRPFASARRGTSGPGTSRAPCGAGFAKVWFARGFARTCSPGSKQPQGSSRPWQLPREFSRLVSCDAGRQHYSGPHRSDGALRAPVYWEEEAKPGVVFHFQGFGNSCRALVSDWPLSPWAMRCR